MTRFLRRCGWFMWFKAVEIGKALVVSSGLLIAAAIVTAGGLAVCWAAGKGVYYFGWKLPHHGYEFDDVAAHGLLFFICVGCVWWLLWALCVPVCAWLRNNWRKAGEKASDV